MELNLLEYVTQEILPLSAALFVIGLFLKKTPRVPDWTIVWVILVLGIVGAVALLWWELGTVPIVQAIIQGVLAAGVPVLVYQLIKQTNQRN
jgi:K+-transporting ATPase A subunit